MAESKKNIFNISKFDKVNKLFLLLFLLTLLSGALRKWVFTSGAIGNAILVLQLFLPYIFILRPKAKGYELPFKEPIIGLFLVLLVVEVFNPMNLTVFHGILGLILHFGFWFTTYFYLVNRDKIDLRECIPLMVLCIGAEIMLGFVQYGLPPSHILNKYATDQAGDIALVGDAVRITGTFSYIGGFTALVCFIVLFVLALLRYGYNVITIVLLIIGGLVASMMSGSRSSTGFFVIMLGVIFIFEVSIKQIGASVLKVLIPAVVLFSIVLIAGTGEVGKKVNTAIGNFSGRVEQGQESGEQTWRLLWDLQDLIHFRGNYPFFGVGLGATYQGATAVFGTSTYVQEYGYYENELTRVVLEGGFVLLVFRFMLLWYLCAKMRVKWITKVVLFVFIFYFNPIVFNVYNSIFFSLGLIFIDNSANFKKPVKSALA